MEKLNKLNEDEKFVPRNSIMFGDWLATKGLTYRDIYYYLNGNGVYKYNDILTKSGCIEKESDGKYVGRVVYHACDNCLRTPEQMRLDCEIGNIQEALFCIDNIDFESNPNATNNTNKTITTKELDLIHKPTKTQVEFKVSYGKLYGHDAYYHHRDGKFREFIEGGNIMIIYFINLDKVAVICKKNLDRSVKIVDENSRSESGKIYDNVRVWDGIMHDYTMMKRGNSLISEQISKIVKYGSNK